MKKLTHTLIFLCCTFALLSQQNADIEKYLKENKLQAEWKYGIAYTSNTKSKTKNPLIQKGDYVKIRYQGQLLDGKVFDASEKEPFVFQVGYGQVIRGLDVGMTLLQEGSNAQLFIPPGLAYGTKGVGKTIPPNASLLFEVVVLDVMNNKEYNAYMVELEQKERLAFENHKKAQFEKDLRLIHEYASSNKIKAKRLPSGLSYAISKKGKGNNAKAGDNLSVIYEGYLLNGEQFDASKGKKPYQFKLGVKKVIDGWEEGLQQFNKGAEGYLLIPSKMAYGPRSIEEDNISIPENSVLVFKIKVQNIEQSMDMHTQK